MSKSHEFGREAEQQGVEFLLGLGYTIVTRRFRSRRGEIDLVALDGDLLVFVEVKARRSQDRRPEESLSTQKLNALTRAAHAYLDYIEEPDRGFRLDLIAIDREGLRHHLDLFG